jgi:hypothetical protein
VPLDLFETASAPWLSLPADPARADQYRRIHTAMKKGGDINVQQRIQRTYFACARFIRLSQLIRPTDTVFAMDIDAVVRKTVPKLSNLKDFYIHHIDGKKARYLAGGMFFPGTNSGYAFLKQYADVLKQNILHDTLYWGIDQDVLDTIVPQYRWGQLSEDYIDWNMLDRSYIWTAKGTRKNLEIFINEQKKYTA